MCLEDHIHVAGEHLGLRRNLANLEIAKMIFKMVFTLRYHDGNGYKGYRAVEKVRQRALRYSTHEDTHILLIVNNIIYAKDSTHGLRNPRQSGILTQEGYQKVPQTSRSTEQIIILYYVQLGCKSDFCITPVQHEWATKKAGSIASPPRSPMPRAMQMQ